MPGHVRWEVLAPGSLSSLSLPRELEGFKGHVVHQDVQRCQSHAWAAACLVLVLCIAVPLRADRGHSVFCQQIWVKGVSLLHLVAVQATGTDVCS